MSAILVSPGILRLWCLLKMDVNAFLFGLYHLNVNTTSGLSHDGFSHVTSQLDQIKIRYLRSHKGS